jgi:hypothetical protein
MIEEDRGGGIGSANGRERRTFRSKMKLYCRMVVLDLDQAFG